MKKTIFGVGLIISGSIGVALGNLEETLFYSSITGTYKQSAAYYMFWLFIILGIASVISGSLEKKND